MKKIFSSKLFLCILTAVICISGAVLADELLNANDILYAPNNAEFNVSTVKEALDELYGKTQNGFCINITGDKNTIGSKYECDPGDGILRTFYVFKVNSETIDLISDSSIYKDVHGSITSALNYLTSAEGISYASTWSNVSVRLPKTVEIIQAVCAVDSTYSLCEHLSDIEADIGYSWYDGYGLPNCSATFTKFGCETFGNTMILTSYVADEQYVLDDSPNIQNGRPYYWRVIGGSVNTEFRGTSSNVKYASVRPVITVSKDNL